tara:strand:+ start:1555 stop:1881 length:327 start_codon:yes stop_codon:yes gene_type:complete
MATQQNIVIDQGTTFSTTITAKDSTGSAKDLTGYTTTAQIRKSYYSSSSTDFTTAQVDGTGVITLSLTAAQTGNLKAGRYVYDVESASASETIRVVEGIVTVTPQVTK